jgi:arsenate reductase
MSPTASERTDTLFLCVANSARSQLAEGLARSLAPSSIGIHSAGSNPSRLHPLAIEVLAEVGIDISNQRSKAISEIPGERISRVITLCAEEVCPIFPGNVEILHWPMEDPAGVEETHAEALVRFRSARDTIESRLRELFAQTATL